MAQCSIMFGVRGERPMMIEIGEKGMIAPLERYGIKLISYRFAG
jgi:ATP-binding protein involved in chromosome partitioning